jgi:prepilin-type N-terminal cleavage/methylation domain-containing protein/prepilin-type processing-associated H-X9-DG protein
MGLTSGREAFTLVELLVVIAIIGILVALLLPAVSAAREAARRTQCMNQVRSMGQAVLNLESAVSTFPSGGVAPWPRIENYSQGGKPFGPPKQGLSWAFQILPYLEEDAVHGLATTEQITSTPIHLYFCPSRRPPTFYKDSDGLTYWLMDYASLNPIPSRAQLGDDRFRSLTASQPGRPTRGCRTAYAFWGTRTYGNDHFPEPRSELGARYTGFNGAIVRSSYFVGADGQVTDLDYTDIVAVRKVKDGLSKTSLIAEKRIRVGSQPGAAYDDRGWSDGWDLDTVSSAVCQPLPDSAEAQEGYTDAIAAGSSHTGGLNVVFCDNSVRFINYDIDVVLWNNMAHCSDGEVIELP